MLIKLILYICLFTFSTLAQADQEYSQLWISRTSCTFYYLSQIENIKFIKCISPSIQSAQWTSCFIKCCQTDIQQKYSSPSQAALEYCQKGETSKLSTVQIGGIAVSAFIFSVLCLYCTFQVCKRCKSKQRIKIHKQPTTLVEWINEAEINSDPQLITWSSKAKSKYPLKSTNQPCVICLEENTTAELFCRHQYHPKCIGSWLNKSNICPCCRLSKIKGIKVYCRRCRWRYFVCLKSALNSQKKGLPLECQVCLNKNQHIQNSLAEIAPQPSQQMLQEIRQETKKQECQ